MTQVTEQAVSYAEVHAAPPGMPADPGLGSCWDVLLPRAAVGKVASLIVV